MRRIAALNVSVGYVVRGCKSNLVEHIFHPTCACGHPGLALLCKPCNLAPLYVCPWRGCGMDLDIGVMPEECPGTAADE
jgi:hypothetical protein